MNKLEDIRKEFEKADREDLLEEILKLRKEKEDLEYDLELMEEDKDDIEEEKDELEEAIDDAREFIDSIASGRYVDMDEFVRFLKYDNLYTDELERFIYYFNTCHNQMTKIPEGLLLW